MMARLFNNQPMIGVVIVNDDRPLFNSLPVIGVRVVAEGVTFTESDRVIGVEEQAEGVSIWNDSPVRGVRLIEDDRPLYLMQPVIPVHGIGSGPGPDPVRPFNIVVPSIAGAAQVDEQLTGSPGTWGGDTPMTFSYRWHRRLGTSAWALIAGANTASYVPVSGDEGYRIRLQVMGGNAAGNSAWVNSIATTEVLPAPDIPVDPEGYLPLTANILNNGHSLVDAIFSGADDRRQTLTTYHPDGPKNWRKWTVPGSSLSQRWLLRNGASDEQFPDPMPAPFDPENEYSPIVPSRDLQFFDAMLITEGGPYTVPLNVDGFNRQWARSKDYFDRWRGLAAGKPVFFWTIWPATLTETQPADDPTWRLDPTDRTDIPPFLAFLDRYEKTAEQWCAENGEIVAKIIPGHRLYWELYCRFNNYGDRPQLPGAWGDIWADDNQFIHANHLGSVFVSVMVYRWLFGALPDAAIVNARLAEAETNQGITAQDVFDTVTATLSYVQGTGVDLQTETFTMPTPFWDASGPGTANVIGTYTPGQPMGTNGLWWELAEDTTEMYLLLRVSHTADSSTQASIFCANNTDWSWWDGKMLGLVMDVADAGENGRIGMVDGSGMMTGPLGVMGGVRNPMWVEGYVGPKGVRVRFLNLEDEFPWLQGFQPRGTKSLPSTRIGVNVTWENNTMRADTGNFAIHEGFTYLGVPDDLTRLRMLHHLLGMVP